MISKRQRDYIKSHRDQRNSYVRKWYKTRPDLNYMRHFRWYLKKMYGLSVEQYHAIIERQKGLCAICSVKLRVATPTQRVARCADLAVVDYKGKIVRGILCNHCNRAIGLLKDNVEILVQAILYIERAQ